jgi:Cyclic nucleotide-binding domain/Ion channel
MELLQFLRFVSVVASLVIGAWLPLQFTYFPLSPGQEAVQDVFLSCVAAVNIYLVFRSRGLDWRRGKNWLQLGVVLDLVCFLPISFVQAFHLPLLLWAVRLLKLSTARHAALLKAILDEYDGISPLLYRLIPILLFVPPLVHNAACAWIALGSGSVGPNPNHWVEYTYAVFWAITSLTTAGCDIVPKTPAQMALASGVQLVGVGIFGFIISNVASLLARMDAAREHHMDNLERAEDFMEANHIPRSLRLRVRAYYHYLWKTHKGYSNRELIAELPVKFQSELLTFINRSMVERVPFLKDAHPELMDDLMRELKPKIYVPGERIFRVGERGNAMYLIHSGNVEILGADQKRIVELRDGAFFGEMALIKDQPRSATAVALTYCDVYVLSSDSFQLVIAAYPEFHQHILQMSEARSAGRAA